MTEKQPYKAIFASLSSAVLILSLSGCALTTQQPVQVQLPTQGQQTSQRQSQGQGQRQFPQQAEPTALPTRVVVASTSVSADGVLTLTAPVQAVGFDESSKVTAVKVEVGQSVKQGEVLGTVDDTSLQDALQDAQLALQLAQANIALQNAPATTETLASAQAALDAAYASYDTTKAGTSQSDIEAAKRSVDGAWLGYLSAQSSRDNACSHGTDTTSCKMAEASYGNAYEGWRAAVDAYQKAIEPVAQTTLTQAYASVETAKAKLDALKAPETEQQAAVEAAQEAQAQEAVKQAQANLEKATLVSPCDCVVEGVNAVVGEIPGSTAFTLVNLSGLEFETTNVVEGDLAKIKEGAEVTIRLRAYTGEFKGQVSAILAQPAGTEGTQTLYTVLIKLNSTSQHLLPGMTGQANIMVN